MGIFSSLFKKDKISSNSVVFVEKTIKDKHTYFVHKAATKADALAFLATKTVTEPLQYIVVYTPEGKFGKDINGGYEF